MTHELPASAKAGSTAGPERTADGRPRRRESLFGREARRGRDVTPFPDRARAPSRATGPMTDRDGERRDEEDPP